MGVVRCSLAKVRSLLQNASSEGQLKTQKAIARSPIAVRELIKIGEELEAGRVSIRETVYVFGTGRTNR